jgi:hypothetical protein
MAKTGQPNEPFLDSNERLNPLRLLPKAPPARVDLKISDLNLETGPFCASFGRELDPLLTSIQRVGLLNPPLVHQGAHGAWEVVCGFQRLRVLRSLGMETCPCRDLSPENLKPAELLLAGVHDNLATRGLNDVEKGMALDRLSAFWDEAALIRDGMALVGLPSRASVLESYRALGEAEETLRAAVAADRLSMKTFGLLKHWSSMDRVEACDWIIKLNLNFNKQFHFIELLEDISIEEAKAPRDLLRSEAFLSLLSEEGVNRPQKSARVLEALRKRHLPTLDAAERTFRKRVSSLGLPKGVRVVHPPGFEGADFRLEVVFRNGSELRERVEILYRTRGLKTLNVPWETEGEGA